jgi:hypothetical protein
MRKLVPAIALIAIAAACSSVPTSPSTVDAHPRFDGGFGMGSGNFVGGSGGSDNTTQTQTATTSTNVVAEDTTSRGGGFGMGSGN